MTGNKNGISQDLRVEDFALLMNLGFILREKKIAVLKNCTREEHDQICFFFSSFTSDIIMRDGCDKRIVL